MRAVAHLLMGLALVAVLALHLLVPLLAGLLVYQLVQSFVPWVERRVSARQGRVIAVAAFAFGVTGAVGGAIFGLVSFFRRDLESLPQMADRLGGVLDRLRTELPPALASALPLDMSMLQQRLVDWVHTHSVQLQTLGSHTLRVLAETLIALIIACVLSLRQEPLRPTLGPLGQALLDRIIRLGDAFTRVAFSQLKISLINTGLTALYLLVVLPLFAVHLPLAKTMIAVTFVAGLLPVVGNLISNSIITVVSLGHSLLQGAASLAFLIGVHKLEYVLGARIVGVRVNAHVWELLLAMVAMEAMFGVPGLVAAPIYYAYLKAELVEARLV